MIFKQEYPIETRIVESYRIMIKYPDKIPVICERHNDCKTVKSLSKKKYLVSMDYTCGQFMYIIRNQLSLPAEHAIFLFVDGNIPSTAQTMSQLYALYKDPDGFLYVNYASENTFGYREPTVPLYEPSLHPLFS